LEITVAASSTPAPEVADANASPADASVSTAVDLGWQIVTLHRWSAGLGNAKPQAGGAHLPGRLDLSEFTQAKLLSQQIDFSTRKLIAPVGTDLGGALTAVQSFFDTNGSSVDDLRNRVRALHLQILESLTVQDLRQAKGYSLGQILADTAADPERSNGDSFRRQMRDLLAGTEIASAYSYLSELKSLLPDHSAYAVTYTLRDWQMWAGKAESATDNFPEGATALQRQAETWRLLLTGEKKATDLLDVGNYATAAREVFGRVVAATRPYLPWILIGLVFLAAAVWGLSQFHDVNPSTRYIANLIWLGGVLGISLKGAGALIGTALKDVEGWLWQSELDESVVEAAAHLPDNTKHKRLRGSRVGEMFYEPKPQPALPPPADGSTAG
jgi:hypothetical protein